MAVTNSFATFYGASYPLESDVLQTAPTYGDSINVLNGTFVPAGATIPAVSDVREGVAVGAGVGILELPTVNQVLLGVGYGANGVEFTGTLSAASEADGVSKDIAFNAGDDYIGEYSLEWTSPTFATMDGTLYFTLVDDRGVEYLNATPTYPDQQTIRLELTHEQTKGIASDFYRYGIRHVSPTGVIRTLARGFASVALSYANTDPQP